MEEEEFVGDNVLSVTKDSGNTNSLQRAESLPKIIKLASDCDEDVTNWYAATFCDELSQVKSSMKIRRSLGGTENIINTQSKEDDVELLNDNDIESNNQNRFVRRLSSNLEIALEQANKQVENQALDNELLKKRLECLEELQELRMKLSAYELSQLLEKNHTQDVIRPSWDKDEDHHFCFICKTRFTLINRKHHCRKCGHIFDERCAPKTNILPIPELGYHTPVRHCINCLPSQYDINNLKSRDGKKVIGLNSLDKQPFSSSIDAIRRLENNCLSNPSSENLVIALQSYVNGIEKIAKADELYDGIFRKEAHTTLLHSMQIFLQMKEIQSIISEDNHSEKTLKKLLSSAECMIGS